MNRNQRRIVGGLAITGVFIVAACIGIWVFFLNDDAPAPVSLQDAVASMNTPTAESEAAGADVTDQAADPTSIETATDSGSPQATGTTIEASVPTAAETSGSNNATPTTTRWSVAAGSDSFVGYRIGEELATIGTTEAVGRTTDVSGEIIISETIIERALIEANMQALTSDDSRRDQTLQDRGLETASYPTATFTLTQPIDLGGELADGAIYSVIATGELTLHGVTQTVEIQLEAQYVNGLLVVVGSLDIELADYNITPPTTRIALAVDDHGTLELQLILSQNN